MLYKKLSNEFKYQLVIVKEAKNLNNLKMLLRNIDANMKKNSKQSQLYIKPNVSNIPTIKPLFKSYNLASTKPSTAIRIVVVFLVPSTIIRTHPGSMNVFNVIRQGPIL